MESSHGCKINEKALCKRRYNYLVGGVQVAYRVTRLVCYLTVLHS